MKKKCVIPLVNINCESNPKFSLDSDKPSFYPPESHIKESYEQTDSFFDSQEFSRELNESSSIYIGENFKSKLLDKAALVKPKLILDILCEQSKKQTEHTIYSNKKLNQGVKSKLNDLLLKNKINQEKSKLVLPLIGQNFNTITINAEGSQIKLKPKELKENCFNVLELRFGSANQAISISNLKKSLLNLKIGSALAQPSSCKHNTNHLHKAINYNNINTKSIKSKWKMPVKEQSNDSNTQACSSNISFKQKKGIELPNKMTMQNAQSPKLLPLKLNGKSKQSLLSFPIILFKRSQKFLGNR